MNVDLVFAIQVWKDGEGELALGLKAVIAKQRRTQPDRDVPSIALPEYSGPSASNWEKYLETDAGIAKFTEKVIAAGTGRRIGLYIVAHGKAGAIQKVSGTDLAKVIKHLGFRKINQINIQACEVGGSTNNTRTVPMDLSLGGYLYPFAKELATADGVGGGAWDMTPLIAVYANVNTSGNYNRYSEGLVLNKDYKNKFSTLSLEEKKETQDQMRKIADQRAMTLVRNNKNGSKLFPLAMIEDKSVFKKVVQWNGVALVERTLGDWKGGPVKGIMSPATIKAHYQSLNS